MRLQRYIFRELLPPLVTGALLFTAVVSFGYFFASSQWLGGAPIGLVLQYIGLNVPDTLVRVFPMAVVLMVVVAYGRLANERELSAAQSGGVSLGRLALPALAVAALVSGLSLFMAQEVVPRANVAARGLYWDDVTKAGLSQIAGRTVNLGNNIELWFGTYDAARREMQNVRVQAWSEGGAGRGVTVFFARTGRYEGNELILTGYRGYTVDYAAIDALSALPEDVSPEAFQAAVQDVFGAANIPADENASLTLETGLSRRQSIAQYADAIVPDTRSFTELVRVIGNPEAPAPERLQARVDLHQKLALPFGNLVLVLAALPFALRFGRTTGVAFGVALLIAVAYYISYVIGLSLVNSGVLPPEIGVWLANAAFALLGIWMLRRDE